MTAVTPMIGLRFDMLTVLERVSNSTGGTARYRCRCDCGRLTVAQGAKMRSGQTKHCGCRKQVRPCEDMTGRICGELVVLKRANNSKEGNSRWLCLCSCGERTTVVGKHLRSGGVRSCGCLKRAVLERRWEALRMAGGTKRQSTSTSLGTSVCTLPGNTPGITRITRHFGGW